MNEWPIKRNPAVRAHDGASEDSQLGSWIPRSLLPPSLLMQALPAPTLGEGTHHTLQRIDGNWWIIRWDPHLKKAQEVGPDYGWAYQKFSNVSGKRFNWGAE